MIFENLPVGVELYDEHSNLLDVNEEDLRIFASSREELVGSNLMHDPSVTCEIKEAVRKGEAFSYPLVYSIQKAGDNTDDEKNLKYLQIKGVPLFDEEVGRIGFLLIITDNTEAHLKAEQTEDNLATMKATLLSGHSMVAEYDTKKHELLVNPMLNGNLDDNDFFALFKDGRHLPLAELESLIHPEDYIMEFDILRRVAAGQLTVCSPIVRMVIKGKIVWLRTNVQAYKMGPDGVPTKVVTYVTNITEEKALEVKLREAELESHRAEMEKLKAQEADKLKSAFLANMSHEIRTPLNAIVGFSALMLETDDREEQQRFLDIINTNNDLLLSLISDILDFSKIESGKLDYTFSDINLKEVCAQLYEVHSLKVQPGVRMIFEQEKLPPVTLYTDAKRVTQVISNLLSNAIKFTCRGTITLSYQPRGGEVYVEVADTGKGIPESFRKSIFQRFVKVDEFMQGTGLGLPISKTIIETLNGTMGVESEEGKGSVFWFTLPLRDRKTEGARH